MCWLDGGKTRNYLLGNIIEIEYYNLYFPHCLYGGYTTLKFTRFVFSVGWYSCVGWIWSRYIILLYIESNKQNVFLIPI